MRVYKVEVTILSEQTIDGIASMRTFNVTGELLDAFCEACSQKKWYVVVGDCYVYTEQEKLDIAVVNFERQSRCFIQHA